MRHFVLVPEAGGWDGVSVADWNANPPKIYELRYEFDYWSDDALLGWTLALIVTSDLKAAIQSARLTGMSFDKVEVWKSEQFKELNPEKRLPAFAWMKVDGKAGENDLGATPDWDLVVSERALKLLQSFGIPHAKITGYEE
jgi:hypothetical protein